MKVVDSVRGEYEREVMRLEFENGARVTIYRDTEQEDGNKTALVYASLPVLKNDLRKYAERYPDMVTIIADDPEADATDAEGNLDEDRLAKDDGLMIAKVNQHDERGIAIVVDPAVGLVSLAIIEDPIVRG